MNTPRNQMILPSLICPDAPQKPHLQHLQYEFFVLCQLHDNFIRKENLQEQYKAVCMDIDTQKQLEQELHEYKHKDNILETLQIHQIEKKQKEFENFINFVDPSQTLKAKFLEFEQHERDLPAYRELTYEDSHNVQDHFIDLEILTLERRSMRKKSDYLTDFSSFYRMAL